MGLSSWFRAESRCHSQPPLPGPEGGGAYGLPPSGPRGRGAERSVLAQSGGGRGRVLRAQTPSSEGAGGWGPELDFEGRRRAWTPGSEGEGSWGSGSGVSAAEGSGAQLGPADHRLRVALWPLGSGVHSVAGPAPCSGAVRLRSAAGRTGAASGCLLRPRGHGSLRTLHTRKR